MNQNDVVALLRALPVGAAIRMRISRQPEADTQTTAGQTSGSDSATSSQPLSVSTVAAEQESPLRITAEAAPVTPPHQPLPQAPGQPPPEAQFREFSIELPLGEWPAAVANSSNIVGVNVHGRKAPVDGALQANGHTGHQADAGIFIKSISESGAAHKVPVWSILAF